MRYRLFYIAQLAILISVLFPFSVFSQTENVCSLTGYTILTINGVLTNEDKAIENKDSSTQYYAYGMVQLLQNALIHPPMPGSTKIFWRNLFLQKELVT